MTGTEARDASNHGAAPAWFDASCRSAVLVGQLEVDGASISYTERGTPDSGRPTLVLVHGGQANRHWWDPVAVLLASAFHVIQIDLSGHGDSQWRDHYSVVQWIREIETVLERRVAHQAIVIGHSLGGGIALHMAVAGNPRLAGVVSVDAAPEGPAKRTRSSRGTDTPRRQLDGERPSQSRSSWPWWLWEYISECSITRGSEPRNKSDRATGTVVPAALARTADFVVPTMIILGARSTLTPSGDQLESWLGETNLRKVDVLEIENRGHDLLMEDPQQLAGIIRSHLNDGRIFSNSLDQLSRQGRSPQE